MTEETTSSTGRRESVSNGSNGDDILPGLCGLIAIAVALGCSGGASGPAGIEGAGAAATGGAVSGASSAATGGAMSGASGAATGGAGGAGSIGVVVEGGTGSATTSASGGTGGWAAAGGAGNAGVAAVNGGGTALAGGSSGNGTTDTSRVSLPPGSREFNGIVNLVDESAARQLEEFILDETLKPVFLRQGLTKALNLFLENYPEDYDFVFFFTDHTINGAKVAGKFEAVNQPAAAGGGSEIEIAAGGYKTNGRTKGVIAIPYVTGITPPLAHETVHYWANNLDPKFGFGKGLSASYVSHWGFSDVNGQLGGFDGSTLRCETPAGSSPPNCTALASGRTRYTLGAFGPNANGFRDVAYGRLELYLMGLASKDEAPTSFQVLENADFVGLDANVAVVEASGIATVSLADIIARHGTVAPLPTSARQFRAAFVVLSSSTPAPESVLVDVASWAALFGGRETAVGLKSFAQCTGGQATMSTQIGLRRSAATPPPDVRERFACDVLTQNCGRPELACLLWPPSYCALSGNVGRDQPCDTALACAPGLDCISSASSPDDYRCKPYCDPNVATAALSCQKLCPGKYGVFKSTEGAVLGALCSQ